jgi:hypothetical protein
MDDGMQVMEAADFEIERRLDSFARARLSPDPQAAARMRARVMREARLRFAAPMPLSPTSEVVALRRSPRRTRRLGLSVLAAAVWLGVMVGSISAAQAGGPLYGARMWIENVTLPVDATARATAELARLDDRLTEVIAAAARGDAGAVQAALDAYRAIADTAIATAAGSDALEALVSKALDAHLAVLTGVADKLTARGNDTAASAVQAAIERTIARNRAAIVQIGAGRGNTGSQDATPAGGGAGGAGGAGGTGGPRETDPATGTVAKPTPTPKPTPAPSAEPVATEPPAAEKTPRPTPDKTAKPVPSERPAATPTSRPTPSPKPDHAPKSDPSH